MTVEIGGRKYWLRYGLRALFMYEQLTGHPYEGGRLEEAYRLLHASLLAHNTEYALSFEELVDACDADPTPFERFCELVQLEADRLAQIKKKATEGAAH